MHCCESIDPALELLNDDYIYGDKKVQLKTKTDTGMTYTATGVRKGDNLIGDLSCKYAMSGATFTTKVFTSDTMTQEVTLENTGVKGLKLTLFGGIGSKQVVVGSAEYVHPQIAYSTSINAIGSPAVKSSLAIGTNGITLGVDGEYDIEHKVLKKCDGIVNFSDGKDQEITVGVSSKGTQGKVAYSHLLSRDFSVAAEFVYNKEKDTKLLTMGTKYEVDRDTTLKAKIDSVGSLSLSYLQEIRSGTKLTLCSRFDVRNLDKTPFTFGLALVVE